MTDGHVCRSFQRMVNSICSQFSYEMRSIYSILKGINHLHLIYLRLLLKCEMDILLKSF